MKKKFIYVLIALLVLTTLSLVGCKKAKPIEGDGQTIPVTSITTESKTAVVVKGTTFDLNAKINPSNATCEGLSYSSSNDKVVSVSADGKCNAVGVGESEITVKCGGKEGKCKVIVGDYIVQGENQTPPENGSTENQTPAPSFAPTTLAIEVFNPVDGGKESEEEKKDQAELKLYGTNANNLFTNLTTALSNANSGSTIVILGGNYNEDITLSKPMRLLGVDYPVFNKMQFNAKEGESVIDGLYFKNTQSPQGGEATCMISTGANVKIQKCKFTLEGQNKTSGGYAILVAKDSVKVEIKDSTIENYRYAIYVQPTSGEIKITNNTLTNLNTGIGIDVRQPNSTPDANYPLSGEIKDNKFNETQIKTQFLFYGESFEGDFDFADHQESQQGQEGNGGGSGNQGLLE